MNRVTMNYGKAVFILFKNKHGLLLLFALLLSFGVATAQTTYFTRQTGPWNSNTTWSTVAFGNATNAGTFPVAGDIVNMGGGFIVTVAADAACASIAYQTNGLNNTIDIDPGITLDVSGAVTIPRANPGNTNVMDVGDGTLNAGSIAFTNTTSGTVRHRVIIADGTVSVTGNVTSTQPSATFTFIGTGLLQVGGTFLTAITGNLEAGNGTVEYNGNNQTVGNFTYNNLILSGSGTHLMAGAIIVNGDLTIDDGNVFTVGAFNLTVTGSTSIGGGASGGLTISSATGTKRFTGTVTIASGATWSNPANEAVLFSGGITNNGTFTAGTGIHTFDINSQQLNGTLAIPSVTVTGAAVQLTNNNSLTVATALSGTGSLIQAINANLDLGGTSGITTLNASSSGNTVSYSGAVQTVKATIYNNLTLSGTGAKTVAGFNTINGNFTMSGSATAAPTASLNIGGSVTLESGTTFTAGAFTHNVGGNWTNNGATFTTTGLINFNGAAQNIGGSSSTTFSNVVLGGSGTKTLGSATFITGNLVINESVVADLGIFTTHTANTLRLGGAGQPAGTSGSSASIATNPNDIYFTATAGYMTVATTPGPITYFSRASGNWNSPGNWSTVDYFSAINAGTYPFPGDIVNIGGGNAVTVTANAGCASITFLGGANVNNTLIINPSVTLDVTGAITIPRAGGGGGGTLSNTLAVGSGTLNAASIAFTAGGGTINNRHRITISTGTVNVTGEITTDNAGASALIEFIGAGTLNAGTGIMTTSLAGGRLTTVAGSTVNYNGADQVVKPVTYAGSLTLSGSGTKTMTGVTTISEDFTMGGSASVTPPSALTIGGGVTLGAGTSFVAGALVHNVAGDWINNGATFTNTGSTINFNGTDQEIGGSSSTTFNELSLSNAGTKTFSVATFIAGGLSINTNVTADLSSITTHTSSTCS